MPEPFLDLLVDFGNRLRQAGLTVGTGDVLGYAQAAAILNPSDLVDLYWAGRSTLVTRRDQIPVYDAVFREYFLGEPGEDEPPEQLMLRANSQAQAMLELPSTELETGALDEDETQLGRVASDIEVLRDKEFSACTPEELVTLRRIMTTIRLTPPRRRSRRTVRAVRGSRPDMRRTVRETLRAHGEPAQLYWRRRRTRARPLVLILDVSGSMADYSRALLQFAYSTKQAVGRVEVFCFGTRLTRITRALERRRPDEAMNRAAREVFDWEGGTRIGASLEEFVRGWGRSGVCRSGIVVICSDGLDRGDPAVLAAAMERLSRLCHRLVWLNPHKRDNAGFRPSTLGMMVAEPYIDVLLSGHDLRSLEEFAALLPDLS